MNLDSLPSGGVSAHSWHDLSSSYVLFTPADLVREVYARYASDNRRGVVSLLTRDVEFTVTPELPWGGVFRGHDGAVLLHRRMRRHIEAAFEPHSFILAGGNKIAVGGKLRGTAHATGRPFVVDMIQLWTVTRGKIERCVSFFDLPAIQRAIGLGEKDRGVDATS